jgi:hypothetical protein
LVAGKFVQDFGAHRAREVGTIATKSHNEARWRGVTVFEITMWWQCYKSDSAAPTCGNLNQMARRSEAGKPEVNMDEGRGYG